MPSSSDNAPVANDSMVSTVANTSMAGRARSGTTKSDRDVVALEIAQSTERSRIERRKARKQRAERRKEQLKRVYASRWERRIYRYVGKVTDFVKHRKRPVVHYDPPTGTLYVGDYRFWGKSFMYFDVIHPIRRGAIMLVCDRWFDRLVVAFLMLHSVSVLYQEPKTSETSIDSTSPEIVDIMRVIDRLLLVFFSLELAIAGLATGVRRMLRSPFKLLDLLVVAIGITIDAMPPDSEALVYLYSFNALRPLRVVQRIRGMRKLMLVVVSCLPTMGSVVILVLVLIFLFSMSGVILFGNSLHTRCVADGQEYANVCTGRGSIGYVWLPTGCPATYNCTGGQPTPSRWANFDNVGAAILSVLQVMTLDDWMVVGADVMNGMSPIAWFYFFLLTVVGSFWAVNLMLAVITDAFSRFFAEEQEASEAIERSEREGVALEHVRTHISKALQGDSVAAGTTAPATGDGVASLRAHFKAEDENDSESSYISSEEENSLVRERVRATNPHLQANFRKWVKSLAHASHVSVVHALRPETLDALRAEAEDEEHGAMMNVSNAGSGSDIANEADVSVAPQASNNPNESLHDVSTSLLFDDRDIVAMAEVYNRHGQAAPDETPGMRRLRAAAEVDARLQRIREWRDEVQQAERDTDLEHDNSKNIDAFYEPVLVVPEASYPVGTPGRLFDGKESSKKGLTLFDRYAAAADEMSETSEETVSEETEQERLDRQTLGRRRYIGHRERARRFLQRLATNVFKVGHLVTDELTQQASNIQHLPLMVIIESIHRSPRFTKFMTAIVLFNCAVLMLVYYGMPRGLSIFVDVVCIFVDVVVVADFLSIYYFDGSKYFFKRLRKSFFGFVDGIVALHCLVDLILAETYLVPELRIIRILRFMKVFRQFELLHWILKLIQSSINYLINLLLLLLMFAIAFAVMGRHAFDNWVPTPTTCRELMLPAQCNSADYCVWVNRTEWLRTSDFEPLKERQITPGAFRNMSYIQLLVMSTNTSEIHNNHQREFLDTFRDYECRQYREFGELAATDRLTFNSFSTSFLTIFNYLTRDNWSAIMYNYMERSPWSAIYFVTVLLLGGYILTSLLVAILLVNFGKVDEMTTETVAEAQTKVDEEQERRDDPFATLFGNEKANGMDAKYGESVLRELIEHGGVAHAERSADQNVDSDDDDDAQVDEDEIGTTTHVRVEQAARRVRRLGRRALGWLCDEADPIVEPRYFAGRAMFFFAKENKIRLLCARIISGQFFPFQRAVFLCALLHGIVGTVDQSIASFEVFIACYILDWIFTILSVVDILMRCIVQGAAMSKQSFLSHDVGNRADTFAVVCSLLAMVIGVVFPDLRDNNYIAPSVALKAFRPIRLMVRSKATKNVFLAVWKTVPAMLNVLGLSGIMFVATAIMCVEAFGGVLQTCSDGSDRSQAECVGRWRATADDNVVMPGNRTSVLIDRKWENPTMYNFDNVFVSFNTLVMVSIVSQWTDVLYQVVDAPFEPGGAPVRDNRPGVVVFFLLWVFFSNFCLLNIFVGTVVDKFTKLKLQMAGSLFLTEEQSEIAHIKKLLHQTGVKKALSVSDKPFINRSLNLKCFAIANNHAFQQIVKFVVLYNLVVIATVHYDQERTWTLIQMYSTIAVTVVFVFEMLVKAGIAGPRAYLAIGFNRIDCFIVAQSLVEVVLYAVVSDYAEQPQLQFLRLIRVLRIVREQKGFRRLIHSGFRSLPAMWNIGSLLVLVFYMFSFLGMSLFGNVRTVFFDATGSLMDHDMNFQNFPRSMITLYLVATLDNWGDVMQGAAVKTPYCVSEVNCGHRSVSFIFFGFFVVAVAFVMVNLFIAVVLENFSESVLLPTYMKERMQDVNVFRSAWVTFDPAGRQIISAANFVPLLRQLPGPRRRLELLQGKEDNDGGSNCSWTQEEMGYYAAHCAIGLQGEPFASTIPTLRQLRVPITWPRQEVLFADAIDAIGEKIFHVQLVTESQAHAKAKKSAAEYGMHFTVLDYHCAVIVQTAWREYVERRDNPHLAASRFKRWDSVLGPILRHIWSHHAVGVFGEESAEDAAKIRKLTRGRRKDRGLPGAAVGAEDADGEQGEGSPQQKHIKEKLSLKAALEERMMDVDEEEPEDDSWKYAIEDVSSDGSSEPDVMSEEFWLTDEARRRKRQMEARGEEFKMSRDLPLRDDGTFQLISLNDLIQRRRRQQDRIARMSQDARTRAKRVPPRGRPKWEPLPMPGETEMTETVKQPKPMTKNQVIMWQQQMQANPALRQECPVTLVPIERKNTSHPDADDSKTQEASRRQRSRERSAVIDENDGEVLRLDDVIQVLRHRREAATARRREEVDDAPDGQTRTRSNYVIFDPEERRRSREQQRSGDEDGDGAASPGRPGAKPLSQSDYKSL